MQGMFTRLTEDEEAVRGVFAGFFANESPPEAVRAAQALGHAPDLWKKLSEMGAPGMALPAEAGGGEATLRDLAVVVEQWGGHIAPVPLVEHTVATRLLHSMGADADLVSRLAAGDQIATIALRPPVDGVARLVPAGAVADLVVAAVDGQVVVAKSAPPHEALPNTGDLPIAHRDLAAATVLGPAGAGWHRAVDEWRALMAMAYVGLARESIRIGVEYVKERHQFGVPVGSFQGVQHGFADAATRMEGASLLANRAVWALDTDQAEASRLAGMALVFCAETGRFAADRSVQYHGGYGYSEEYDIQLYHRRASAWMLQLGDPGVEIARLADAEFGPRSAA